MRLHLAFAEFASTVECARLQKASKLILRMHARQKTYVSEPASGARWYNFQKTHVSHSKHTTRSLTSLFSLYFPTSDFLGIQPDNNLSSSSVPTCGRSPVAIKNSPSLYDELQLPHHVLWRGLRVATKCPKFAQRIPRPHFSVLEHFALFPSPLRTS